MAFHVFIYLFRMNQKLCCPMLALTALNGISLRLMGKFHKLNLDYA